MRKDTTILEDVEFHIKSVHGELHYLDEKVDNNFKTLINFNKHLMILTYLSVSINSILIYLILQ